jgi:hypothetical protein
MAGEVKPSQRPLARTLSHAGVAKPLAHAKVSPLITSIIGGTVGGVAVTFMGHPADTVKVRLQCQQLMQQGAAAKYSGVCARACAPATAPAGALD